MQQSTILQYSFHNWYENFKHLTIKSVLIPFPDGFKEYLLQDSIILPDSADDLIETCSDKSDVSSDENNEDKSDWDSSRNSTKPKAPKFEEFDNKIKNAIKKLGGKVFPKLNWSSPRDASWIALNNSCCCVSLEDIYLLLKSSDFAVRDLTLPFLYDSEEPLALSGSENLVQSHESNNSVIPHEIPYFLILRRWTEINPDTEFRCFVKDNVLIGISQRDLTLFSEYNVSHKNNIVDDIFNFFTEEIQFNFPSCNYFFDVARLKEDSVILIDFGMFNKINDSLLFDWDELNDGKMTIGPNIIPEYRCVVHDRGIQPNDFSKHALPKDIIDITSGEDSFKFMDLLKLFEGQQINESSDED